MVASPLCDVFMFILHPEWILVARCFFQIWRGRGILFVIFLEAGMSDINNFAFTHSLLLVVTTPNEWFAMNPSLSSIKRCQTRGNVRTGSIQYMDRSRKCQLLS